MVGVAAHWLPASTFGSDGTFSRSLSPEHSALSPRPHRISGRVSAPRWSESSLHPKTSPLTGTRSHDTSFLYSYSTIAPHTRRSERPPSARVILAHTSHPARTTPTAISPWPQKDARRRASCAAPYPSHAPPARSSSSQAGSGQTDGSVSTALVRFS